MNKLLNSSQFSLAVSTITSLGLGYYIYTSNSRLEEQIRTIEDRLNKMDQVFKQTLNTVSNSKDENQNVIKRLADDVDSTRNTITLLKDATELMAAKMGYVSKKKSMKYSSRHSRKTATKAKSRSRDDSDRDRNRGERTKGRRNRSTRYDESDSSTDVSYDDSYSDSTDYSSDEQPIASSKKSRRKDRTDRRDRDRDRGDRTMSRRYRGDRGERTKGRGNKRKDKDRYEDESDDMDDLDELAEMMNSMNMTGEETA